MLKYVAMGNFLTKGISDDNTFSQTSRVKEATRVGAQMIQLTEVHCTPVPHKIDLILFLSIRKMFKELLDYGCNMVQIGFLTRSKSEILTLVCKMDSF